MLEIRGPSHSVCRGISRRELLQVGGAGLFGLTVPKLLQAEESSVATAARAKSVIFLFLFGGPSQLETFDLKPEAASKVRGPYSPIACRTPDLRISEKLPACAAISDKFAVVRTLSHSFNDHSGGGHYVQTGKRWHIPLGAGFNATPQDWPSICPSSNTWRKIAGINEMMPPPERMICRITWSFLTAWARFRRTVFN